MYMYHILFIYSSVDEWPDEYFVLKKTVQLSSRLAGPFLIPTSSITMI